MVITGEDIRSRTSILQPLVSGEFIENYVVLVIDLYNKWAISSSRNRREHKAFTKRSTL
jgi:hypothetical protein